MSQKECICERCGCIFVALKEGTKYCSEKCLRGSRKTSDNLKTRNKVSKNIIPKIQIIYKDSCAVCGWKLPDWAEINGVKPSGNGNEVHHITEISKGGESTIDNMILLCPNCHKSAHAGIIPEKYLRSIVKKKIDDSKRDDVGVISKDIITAMRHYV